MRPVAKPGSILRKYRRESGWTLAFVSERTGLPVSTLSRIENDQISPTYGQLSKLSNGLAIDIAKLLSAVPIESQDNKQRRSVNRIGSGEILDMAQQTLRYLSSDILHKQFTPIIGEVKARTLDEVDEFLSHPGEEFIFVIEGLLEFHTGAYAPVTLVPGESVYFDSAMPHAYLAKGEDRCRILSICSAPWITPEGR
ncbi:helix-turn-helix domain-containing protein [Sphingosinicella rhizophila]|uniref:XRE family transcriptional regulator n=1 Tax=Sphingosinicella rhizophila TaxID=3050082 RepID=A0ABU3Q643_9SPHN|nr:XRE family transcriptional regulator [Sphingosinicella sp. GR2756]MDT9598883.1 XRE family transcriptional regulator [Sphingosinicella sp. GR2756]